jgi:hypothetical protein
MIEALRKQITDFCSLGDRVVDQARPASSTMSQFRPPRKSTRSLNPTPR